jgi:hypothetical protein
MIFVAIIIGFIAILALIAYWAVMLMLFIIWVVFLFWAAIFTYIFGDPYSGSLCSVFATAITFWLYGMHSDNKAS